MDTQATTRGDEAAELFAGGFNCAQSVLMACGLPRGLDRLDMQRYASGLGGGVYHRGQVCGALSGAALLIGYLLPKTDTQDRRGEGERIFCELVEAFRAQQGSISCRDLLEVDLSTQQGREDFRRRQLRQTVCTPVVRLAGQLLEGLLAANNL